MRKTNRGFTIVELVIVIAVIAVLASVLIPTFSGIISKANESSARQEATNLLKEYCINNPNMRSFTDGETNYYIAYFTVVRGSTSYIFRYGMEGDLEQIDESDLPAFSGYLCAEVYDAREDVNTTDAYTKLYKKKLSTGEYIYYQVSPADDDGNSSIVAVFDMEKCYWTKGGDYFSLTRLADIVFSNEISDDEKADDTLATFKDAVGLVYQPDGNGHTSIVGYEGSDPIVVVPNTAPDGEPVTSIKDGAFRNSSVITDVTMGKNIKEVRSNAFTNCKKLQTITLNDGIEVIWACAFSYCRSLSSINFPSSVNEIGAMAFKACDCLTSVILPDGCSIHSGAFGEAPQISFANGTDTMSDSTYIYRVFGGALVRELKTGSTGRELISLKKDSQIPDDKNITCIGEYCFSYDNITSVHIPDSVTVLYDRCFCGNSTIREITGGNSVNKIGISAFQNCTKLENFTLPDKLVSLGEHAFSGCNKLTVTLKNNLDLKSGTLSGVLNILLENNDVYNKIGKCVVNRDDVVCQCEYGATIPDDSSVTVLGDNCFSQSQLKDDIDIPENIKELGEYCFSGSSYIKKIRVGNNVEKMGSNCFSYNVALTSAVLECEISDLPGGTFYSCTSLVEVTLPKTISAIGNNAFYGCKSLTTIRYGGTKADWQSITFGKNWNGLMPKFSVICSDGTLISQ